MNDLMQMVEQFTKQNLNQNNDVDTNQVAKETGSSLIEGIKNAATQGNLTDLFSLGDSNDTNALASNPMVGSIIENLSGKLSQNTNMDAAASNQFASSTIPQLLGSVISSVKEGKLDMSQIMELAASAGLDQNGDGKLDLQDAMAAITNGKLGDMLGGFFKK